MNLNRGLVVLCLGCAFLSSGLVWAGPAEDGARVFSEGKTVLAQGDFPKALECFATAVKSDRKNAEYRAAYSLLRQVTEMRRRLENNPNAKKWKSIARGLRTYYHENKVHTEALALDRRIHARLNNAASAAMLAETELTLGMNVEAAELLAKFNDQKGTPRTRLLLGIALARQGQADQARSVAGALTLPKDAGPGLFLESARFHALLSQPQEAMQMLARSFELTPPSRLEGAKDYARQCEDLESLRKQSAFAEVFKTKSKVPESKCSQGSSCGKCPHRSSCKKDEKKK